MFLAFLLLYLIAMSSFMLTVFAGAVGSPGKQDLVIAGVTAFTEVI